MILTLDPTMIFYAVLGLVPNLLLILWAIARLNREVRVLTSELGSLKRDMQLVDESVRQVSETLRRTSEHSGVRNWIQPFPADA